jgi:phthiocerol/phenolphthiocerol synthesis type-I polyketide synthase E
MMDPQQRIFLECAWQSLERAEYNPETYDGLIGVYAGTSLCAYMLLHLTAHSFQPEDSFKVMIENDKDFLITYVSYKLNLKGPASIFKPPAQPLW